MERCTLAEALKISIARAGTRPSDGDLLLAVLEEPTLLAFFAQRAFDLTNGRIVATHLTVRGPSGPLRARRALYEEAVARRRAHALDVVVLHRALEAAARLPRPGAVHVDVLPSTIRLVDLAAIARKAPALRGPLRLELGAEHAPLLPGLADRLDVLRALDVGLSIAGVDPRVTAIDAVFDMRPAVLKSHPRMLAGLEGDAEAEEAWRAMAELGRRLGATVIAEGVSSRAQRRRLLELGLSHGQSDYFGPALPLGGASR